MKKKVYISGMHSGQSPCAGVGIARSLKKAFPDLSLVGVDHWQGSSGLHDAIVDEVLLLPQWKQIDDDRHVAHLRSLMNEGNIWIPALDTEVHWLAEKLGTHSHLLAPGAAALELTAKPGVRAFEGPEFRVSEFISASLPDSDIHSFLRHSSWQCWLKSPYHDAKRITSWAGFERARDAMVRTWKTTRLFLQRHVVGNEESIAFTAYRGKLLSAVHLQKYQITAEGKTWAGRVVPVDAKFFEWFKEPIRMLEWSGGGEIEFVRDPDGQRWIIECNPRFPAWIYGGALAGQNLPAKLVSEVWNLPILEAVVRYPFFTRVVQEVPAKESVGFPLPADPSSMTWAPDGKKGKGGPVLTSLPDLKNASEDFVQDPEPIPELFMSEIAKLSHSFIGTNPTTKKETPARMHLKEWTHSRFQTVAQATRACRGQSPEIRIGFSVKTSPTDEHLRKAKEHGFLAECISQREVSRALGFGFRRNEIILNGPGKFWPLETPPLSELHMLFCDSVEEFDRVIETPELASCLGFRIRLPKLESRFGNSIGDFEQFQRILKSVRKTKGRVELGFHFHMPSWAIGIQRWSESLQSLIVWCHTVEQLTGVPVRRLDLGGGFFPADLANLDFAAVQETIGNSLPSVRAVYFEPGRSLTQDGEALVAKVLDVRKTHEDEIREIVVDACIAELPLAQAYNHRLFYRANSPSAKCSVLKKGSSRILGRICMEDDILSAGVELPEDVNIGDLVIFGDAGGYERTMSYEFGRG